MTDQVILQLITVVTLYCQSGDIHGAGAGKEYLNGKGTVSSSVSCFQKIWDCGHKVTTPAAIVSETHNCISRHVDGKL